MKYTNVNVSFLSHDNPALEKRIREGCKFLETMLNSEMFKDFVMEEPYIAKEPRENIYKRYLEGDANLVFEFKHDMPNMEVGFSRNKDTDVITVYEDNMNYDIPKMAAYIAHEYGHIQGFHHPRGESWAGSFSFYLQDKGERLFREFYKKLKNKSYPKKGQWLVYEPWCKFIWFYKVLKWKNIS